MYTLKTYITHIYNTKGTLKTYVLSSLGFKISKVYHFSKTMKVYLEKGSTIRSRVRCLTDKWIVISQLYR